MSLVVTTVNVNGIRAAVKTRNENNPGMLAWLEETSSDVVLMQETRATEQQVRDALAPALDSGWHVAIAPSAKKGHAGVGVLSRIAPDDVRIGLDSNEFDELGRYIEVDFGDLTAASVYVPKGAAEGDKYDEKFRFLDALEVQMARLVASNRAAIIAGDWNIAPAEADIKNWKGNVRNPGFLPEEREWVARQLSSGWRDVARELHPDESGPYSWWSWRGKAFDNDAGWRIDYHLVTEKVAGQATAQWVDRAEAYDRRWSDHAPVTVDLTG